MNKLVQLGLPVNSNARLCALQCRNAKTAKKR